MFQRCLICTDFTDGLQKLIYFIPSLTKGGFKEIVFLHSVSWEEGEISRLNEDKINEVKEKLSPALENIPPNVKVTVEVTTGEPLDNIPKIVQKYSIDVIITATTLRSSFQEKIFGSTTMGLTKSVDVPLMIFRPQLISVYTEEELNLRCQHLTRSILIPCDDREITQYLLAKIKDYAAKQSENSLSKCILVWVIEDTSRSDILQKHHLQEAQTKLNQVKTDLETLGLEVETLVKTGQPLTEILQVAYDYDISAIAVAVDAQQNLLQWTVPNFSKEVLHRSWFPLIFFTKK